MERLLRSLGSWIRRLNPNRSFQAKLALTIGGISCMLLLLVNAVAGQIMTKQLQAEIGRSLVVVAHQIGVRLDRAMFERYREINLIADDKLIKDPNTDLVLKRSILETIQATYPYYAWLGIANPQGEVVAATNKLLEGENIRNRPVFQGGKSQPFVGDVHKAKLLAKYVARDPETGEPTRLLDISAPIKDERNNVVGVLVSHLSWMWVNELNSSLAYPREDKFQFDLLILNPKGEVLFGPAVRRMLDGKTEQEAGDERDGHRVVTAIDREKFLVGHSHTRGYREYPGLGWVVLLSQPIDTAFAPVRQMQRQLLVVTGLGSALLGGLCWLFASRLTRPIAQLAKTADRLSQDRSNAPFPILFGENEVARLSRSLHHLLQQRQQFDTIIQQQEETYRLLFEASPLPMWVVDRETMRYVAVNEAAIQHYGYSEAEWLSMSAIDICPPEDAALLHRRTGAHRDGYVGVGMFRHLKKDGSLINVELTSNSLTFQGRSCWLTVGNDVTEREQSQNAVQEREQTLQFFFRYVPLGVVMLDRELCYLHASRRWLEDRGLGSIESILGRSHYEVSAEVSEESKQVHQRCLAGAIERNEAELLVRADGSQQWARWEVRPWHQADQTIGGIIIFTEDITERLQAELRVREGEREAAILAEASPVAICRLDPANYCIYVNQRWCEMMGRSAESAMGLGWLQALHPDEIDRLSANWQEWAETSQPQELYQVEGRCVRPDGSVVWYYSQAIKEFDEAGNLLCYVVTLTDITDRKLAEASLRLSEERYRCLVETATNSVWITDARGNVLQPPTNWIEITGQDLDSDSGWSWLEMVHPDDRDLVTQTFGHCLATGDLYELEYRVLAQAGEWRWLLAKGIPVYHLDGSIREWVGTLTDITDRRVAETSLRENEQQLRTVLENMPVMMDVFDAQGNIIIWNQECERVTGYSAAEVINNPTIMQQLYPDSAYLEQMLQQWATQGNNYRNWEWEITAKDGSSKTVAWSSIADQFPILGWANWGIGVDVTDRKQAEIALQQAEAQLRQTNQDLELRVEQRTVELERTGDLLRHELQKRTTIEEQLRRSYERISTANSELARASRLKDEFLANMSHELRTPLNAVLGLSEALLEEVFGDLTPQQRISLSTIESSGKHLLGLINDILDLSKIESGQMELHLSLQAVHDLCNSSLLFVRQQAEQKSLRLQLQLPDSIQTALLDANRIRQALINLLSNAVKFTPDGGEVRLEVEAVDNILKFHVVDTGIGIAADQFHKLFQPFVQLESSLSRRYAGTGLGLALVSRIAELHGGSISLESEVGRGSRFTITVPYTQTPFPTPATEPTDGVVTSTALNLNRALIIEDEVTVSEQISRYLSELNVATIVLPNCSKAVETAAQTQPGVIILDILLPDCSGWDILVELKANPQTQTIPVLIVSAVDEPPQATQLGATEYLVKPVSRAKLHMALHQLFNPTIRCEAISMSTQQALILLAEDNEANIMMMLPYLEAHRYRVIIARNGLEAVQAARADKPDLVLMDVQMPEMDGLEAMRQIRLDSNLKDIPIIALTALAMPGDRDRCISAGANDYLPKPVSLKQLRQMLNQYLEGAVE